MSDRMGPKGMDRALTSKMASKYDPSVEEEIRGWIQELIGVELPEGQYEVEKSLRDGQILLKLLAKIYEGTPNLPAECNDVNIKASDSDQSFKQMENIENFLKGCKAYGVPQNGLFASVDLFEGRNMAMVLATILQLGSEAQRNQFGGRTIGPAPMERSVEKKKEKKKGKKKSKFTKAQLRAGQGMLTLQTGTNKFATQQGMRIGTQRHVTDIRADDVSAEGSATLSLQTGTNKFASQKGMRIGTQRHVSDIKTEELSAEGSATLSLQTGTNKFASQKGMRIGTQRHVADIKTEELSAEGSATLSLQTGTNKFASQKGMRIGTQRHVSDIKADDVSAEGMSTLSLQSGTNKFDSQKGMTGFGAMRHVTGIKVEELFDGMSSDEEEEDEETQGQY